MEQPTPANAPDDDKAQKILESQIRENYGKIVYSHKAQEKCADLTFKSLKQVKLAQICLSAATTAGLLVTVFGKSNIGIISATIISTVLLVLNAYTKDNDLGALAQKHVETANSLWEIRESYLSLLTDIATGALSVTQIRNRRDELQERLAGIYQNAPRTNAKAYGAAQKALQINEDLTFSDAEIDKFLPGPLRKG